MRKLCLFLFPTILGCTQVAVVTPRPIPDTDMIGAMCQHLGPKEKGGLGCEEGKPVYNSDLPGTPGVPNQSCTDFYTELQAKGYFVNPRCILLVSTCDAIEAARQKTCP